MRPIPFGTGQRNSRSISAKRLWVWPPSCLCRISLALSSGISIPLPAPPCVFGSWLGARGLRTVLKQTRRCPQPWKSGSDLKEFNKSRSAALYCGVPSLLSPSFTFSLPFLFDIYLILCPYCCFTFLRCLFASLCLYPFSVITRKGHRF